MNNYKTIGILGGMGPEATAELYKRIAGIYQRQGAIDDADFPNILINSVPAEDMLNDLANRRPAIVKQLQNAAKVLERAGADFVAMPCNTATLFLKDIQETASIPIMDITGITAQQVISQGAKTVGMLASTSTIKTKIYEDVLEEFSVKMLKPSDQDQDEVNRIIMRILAGRKSQADRQKLQRLALQMKRDGAQVVVLGCTELPLLVRSASGVRLIDTIELLAEATVQRAGLFSGRTTA